MAGLVLDRRKNWRKNSKYFWLQALTTICHVADSRTHVDHISRAIVQIKGSIKVDALDQHGQSLGYEISIFNLKRTRLYKNSILVRIWTLFRSIERNFTWLLKLRRKRVSMKQEIHQVLKGNSWHRTGFIKTAITWYLHSQLVDSQLTYRYFNSSVIGVYCSFCTYQPCGTSIRV